MTTGLLTDTFAYGHAAATSWRLAAEACLAQCGPGVRNANLGFVYATDSFAESFTDIVDFLRRRTGVEHWVGTVGLGICATGREYLDEPALAVMCCAFEDSAFRVLGRVGSPRDVAQAKLEWGNHSANFAVLHADSSNRSLTSLVRELAGRTQSGFVVGGLTQLAWPQRPVRRRVGRGRALGCIVFRGRRRCHAADARLLAHRPAASRHRDAPQCPHSARWPPGAGGPARRSWSPTGGQHRRARRIHLRRPAGRYQRHRRLHRAQPGRSGLRAQTRGHRRTGKSRAARCCFAGATVEPPATTCNAC